MKFNSIDFLIFFFLFYIFFILISKKFRIHLCLFASYFFYSFWDWRFSFLLLVSSLIDYFCGKKISTSFQKKRFLFLSISSNLIILGFFKYFNFFSESFSNLARTLNIEIDNYFLNIILPIGISFYTFQSMSYTIDIYNKKIDFEKNLVKFLTFVSFFPQLVAGPIIRAKKFFTQVENFNNLHYQKFLKGIEFIIYGFFLKLCIADRVNIITEKPSVNPENFGGGVHLLCSISYSFQIYADFAGYSLIAIGLSKMMNINLETNFLRPYLASSFIEFWRRWHISLSTWLRDYLYIPLGGNRKGQVITIINILIVMLVGGLWHGASFNFIVWGFFHGILLCVNHLKIFYIPNNIFLIRLLKILFTFLMVSLLWVFFRTNEIGEALRIIELIFTRDNYFKNINYDLFNIVIAYANIIILLIIELINESNFRVNKKHRFVASLIFLWLILFLGVFDGSNFIYFKF